MRKIIVFLISGIFSFSALNAQKNSAEIAAEIKALKTVGSVLYFAAHPDDENNAFLPYLTKERNYRTAYLSLTRGDGGQNLIGKEQGVELGMIRTQELLAARKIDGAEQYFSTAYEFGFSKSAEEALQIWDHEKVLSDAVFIIRTFQPDIIITRFPGDARAGHGHHAASAIIANEAFIAAADPKRFPEQFKYGLGPWQAKRILWNTFNFGTVNTTNENQLKLEVGGYNPILGKSYGEIGAEARTMHKSQGEGRPRRRGASYEYFELTGGEPAKSDIMDGVNTTWERLGDAGIEKVIDSIYAAFDILHPEKSIPALVKLRKRMERTAYPNSSIRTIKLGQLQDIIQDCAGLYFEATTQQQQVVPGDKVQVQFLLNQRAAANTILKNLDFPDRSDSVFNKPLLPNQNFQLDFTLKVPANMPISQPYWLELPKTEGMFVVKDQFQLLDPVDEPSFNVNVNLEIEKKWFIFSVPVQYKYTDPTKGDVYQPIAVVPATQVKYDKEVSLIKDNKPIKVGYQTIEFNKPSKQNTIEVKSAEDKLPTSNDAVYTKTIAYDHIPTLTYFPTATTKIVPVAVKNNAVHVGYIDGAGDKLPEALVELGANVTHLTEADITPENLKQFDAIVVGIRAYNMYAYLTEKNDVFNEYIAQGGNLVVQYLKSNQVGIKPVKVGPYKFSVNASKRVTQENVPVTFTLPNHAVLNLPNKITEADFENWTQERSTYQSDNFDAHFEAPLTMNDKGEAPSNGSLLIAPYGKGNMVYVSLVLFRQLPAGNPGAYKLLANIISLPKHL
jgi:LmbE family N-acetylglucosaminyl deacetylase